MSGLLFSLTLVLLATTVAKTQFSGCFYSAGCTGSVSAVNAEDCCVNNPSGLYFTNGGQCLQCIVYGWGDSSFTERENQTPHKVPLAYFKGPQDVSLILNITTVDETAKSDVDYTVNGIQTVSLNLENSTSILFRPDNVAMESDETFELDLVLANVMPSEATAEFSDTLPNVFFQKKIKLTIQDNTELIFQLREADRIESEDNRFIEVVVEVANQRELASPMSLVLTPTIVPLKYRLLPNIHSFERANTYPGRTDFNAAPIRLDFPAGRRRELTGRVPIIDDSIHEASEYFIVKLSFADPVSDDDPIISIGRNVTHCLIVDNDDIFIGFKLSSKIFPEMSHTHEISIVKNAGNVTEREIFFIVYYWERVPSDSEYDIATLSDGDSDNDLVFGGSHKCILGSFEPDEREKTVPVTIFDDELPENIEAGQLTLGVAITEVGGVSSPSFEILPENQTFTIRIDDDDRPSVPREVKGHCFSQIIVVWRAPSHVIGDVTQYELTFFIRGASVQTVFVFGDQTYYFVPSNMFGTNQMNEVTLQVRAHAALVVGRWSEPKSLGC